LKQKEEKKYMKYELKLNKLNILKEHNQGAEDE